MEVVYTMQKTEEGESGSESDSESEVREKEIWHITPY